MTLSSHIMRQNDNCISVSITSLLLHKRPQDEPQEPYYPSPSPRNMQSHALIPSPPYSPLQPASSAPPVELSEESSPSPGSHSTRYFERVPEPPPVPLCQWPVDKEGSDLLIRPSRSPPCRVQARMGLEEKDCFISPEDDKIK